MRACRSVTKDILCGTTWQPEGERKNSNEKWAIITHLCGVCFDLSCNIHCNCLGVTVLSIVCSLYHPFDNQQEEQHKQSIDHSSQNIENIENNRPEYSSKCRFNTTPRSITNEDWVTLLICRSRRRFLDRLDHSIMKIVSSLLLAY